MKQGDFWLLVAGVAFTATIVTRSGTADVAEEGPARAPVAATPGPVEP